MRLWTFQGIGHSLTDGQIDLRQSPYNTPQYEEAINELAKRFEPSGQIIWCFTHDARWRHL